jgi:hypothetical protein
MTAWVLLEAKRIFNLHASSSGTIEKRTCEVKTGVIRETHRRVPGNEMSGMDCFCQ